LIKLHTGTTFVERPGAERQNHSGF